MDETRITSPRRRARLWARSLALAAVLAVTGCATGRNLGGDPFRGGAGGSGGGPAGSITIEVQNLNFNEISVFAFRRGERIRVGQVGGKTDRTFTIRWDFAVPVSLRVEAVGGATCNTRDVNVDPGAEVWLQVPSDMGLSQCRASRR